MSREVDMIFDAFIAAGAAIHREDERQKKLAHLKEMSDPKCGNCDHWMKRGPCPREPGLGSGQRGPSCSGLSCFKYQPTSHAIKALAEYRELRAQ